MTWSYFSSLPSPGAFLPGKQGAVRILFVVKPDDTVIEYLGLMHISAVVKAAGHECLGVATRDHGRLAATIAEFRPGIVGFSMTTGVHLFHLDLVRRLKKQFDFVSVFGGPHPTYFPEIVREEGVDIVCVGEGEYPMLELADHLEAGTDYCHIPNLIVKQGGELLHTPPRPFVQDLDALPFPDRELLYAAHEQSRRTKIKPFITGRGCPYNCAFCFNKAYSDLYGGQAHRFRRRSVDNVIRELKEVTSARDVRFILFMDDTFILQDKWLQEFMLRYQAEIGLPFWCQVRANLVTDEKIALFKEAGCVSVSFGLEAGNDHLRNAVLNRNMSREEILGAAEILRRHGVAFMTNNMLGLPTGSLETDFETLDLNARCRPAYANVFLFQPYPKTALGEWAYREGWMMGSFDDLSGSVSDDTVIRFGSEQEKRQIENLQKLFALGVELPWLLPLIRRLIRLPSNRPFWLVYKLWKGWAIKRRMFPFAMSPREYLDSALYYMRIKSQ